MAATQTEANVRVITKPRGTMMRGGCGTPPPPAPAALASTSPVRDQPVRAPTPPVEVGEDINLNTLEVGDPGMMCPEQFTLPKVLSWITRVSAVLGR